MHIPPDWGIFSILIVSFLIFWFTFGWIFFAPFLKLLSDRERRLREVGDRTEQLLREEKAAVQAREAGLAAVRNAALTKRETERRRAEADAARMIAGARDESKAELDRVRQSIEQEFGDAAGQLEQLARTLAADLAGRVLGRPLTNGSLALQ